MKSSIHETIRNVKANLNKTLSEMELGGYEITKCKNLWNTLTFKQKVKWIIFNKIFKKLGESERSQIDELNLKEYELSPKDYNKIDYPWWAVPNPKSILMVEININPKRLVEFVSISLKF